MKILKRILLGVALLVALPFVAALFLPKDFDVSRTVIVDRPRADVFGYCKLIKHQLDYAVWFKLDPAMKTSFRGEDGTQGFVMAWSSTHQEVGTGEQEIVKLVENERIEMEIRFSAPFVAKNPAVNTFEVVDPSHTRVTNTYHGHMDYPANLLCSTVKQQIDHDMQKNLSNLKALLEKR